MTRLPRLALATLLAAAGVSPAWGQGTAPVIEGFNNVSGLAAAGWSFQNNSVMADTNYSWRQGSAVGQATGAFVSQDGGTTGGYARSDYLATGDNFNPATVSDWLILPTRTISNGATLTFWTRTNAANPPGTTIGNEFPERLTVRLSTNGGSGNVGTGPDDVGDFTRALLTVNPNLTSGPVDANGDGYNDFWTQYTVTVTGLASPTNGRIAFHHYVTDSGPGGINGNQLALDTVFFNPVPEPAGLLAAAGLGVAAVARLRRRG